MIADGRGSKAAFRSREGCEALVLGTRARVDEAMRRDDTRTLVLLYVTNTHNPYNRRVAQEAISGAAEANPYLHQLEVAHADIFMRDPDKHEPVLLTRGAVRAAVKGTPSRTSSFHSQLTMP